VEKSPQNKRPKKEGGKAQINTEKPELPVRRLCICEKKKFIVGDKNEGRKKHDELTYKKTHFQGLLKETKTNREERWLSVAFHHQEGGI